MSILEFYNIVHSLELESIPYVLNVEIFPSRYLGLRAGIRSNCELGGKLDIKHNIPIANQSYDLWGTFVLCVVLSAFNLIVITF